MSSRRLKIAVKDHRGIARPLMNALRAAGHEFTTDLDADVLLIDLDPPYGHRELIRRHHEAGAKVILFPHGGGGPVLSYDGLFEPDERVFANLVTGVGHAEFLRRIDYPAPVHRIGWTFCDQRPFRASTDVQHVLFAPTHPDGNGAMTDFQRSLNTDVFRRLLETPFKLTVRLLGSIEANGLWKAKGVTFVDARRTTVTTEIDVVDAVVAGEGTFPSLAIARGVPTVIYSQGNVALGIPGEDITIPDRLDLYMDYIRYPFDADEGPLEELIRTAAVSDEPIADYRRRFVGEPFDPLKFVQLFERLVLGGHAPVQLDATRKFTTLAFADELLERPELLREYVANVRPEDDASLILWAPALDADALLATAEAAITAAGLDDAPLPDILLAPLPGAPQTDAALAARADALLSDWPKTGQLGRLPRFAAAPVALAA